MDLRLSVLDLSPVSSGSNGAQALRNTLEVARLADRLGYERYWLAEHHNLPSVASSAPEVMIGHVASETSSIRVGAGGIMLPTTLR
jgi:luciferase family oxidoreductase group 1